jgi:dihydroorotase
MMLLKNARVIDPASGLDSERDIWIEQGKIRAIDRPGVFDGISVAESHELKGCVIAPGFIDVHVHLREPGFEHKETVHTGALAAVRGGFTSIAPMANTDPVNDNAIVTRFILDRARSANLARVFPIGAVTKGQKGEELAEIGLMAKEGIRALSDDGMPVMNSALMRRAMEYARMFDLPVISHAEDASLSKGAPMTEGAVSSLLGYPGNPNASEEIMVAREIALCRATGARVHLAHLSTREGVALVRRAKEDGLPVTAEVTPHHLMLNEFSLLQGGHACVHHQPRTDYKMAPPLRSERDQEALREALRTGVIDLVASDHAPHGCVDKEVEFELAANGILGLQTTVPLLLELVNRGVLSWSRMIESLTVAPARLLGLRDLGRLQGGNPADLVVLDPRAEFTLRREDLVSISENSPFIGRKFQGKVLKTMVGGVWK